MLGPLAPQVSTAKSNGQNIRPSRGSDAAALGMTVRLSGSLASRLRVSSGTGVEVTLAIAGPGSRAFAFLCDWGIRASVSVGWYVLAALLYNRTWDVSAPLNPDAIWFIFVVAPPAGIYFLYHVAFESFTRGSTPGKRIAHLRILTLQGSAPSVGAILIRNVFRLVDSLPVAYAVGLLVTMCTRTHVRIGDLAAGTLLVYDQSGVPATSSGFGADTADSLRVSLLAHAGLWKSASDRTRRFAQGHTSDASEAVAVADDYRLLAHDVARARLLMPETSTLDYLEAAYARAHANLYRQAWHPWHALLFLFREDIPTVTAQLRPYIIWVTSLFMLAVMSGYGLVYSQPGLIALFASPELITSVERGQLWTEGLLNVVPSSVLSLQILTNNVVVSLFAYCAGFLFGLGTLYIVSLNGLMLGAVFAFARLHGLGFALFRFIVAHGCVEISVMCLSGAAGAAVGEALIRPRGRTRAASFQVAALRSGKLILACVILLIGCGIIEGYVSTNPAVGLPVRLMIGLGYWIFMVALLRGSIFTTGMRLDSASAPEHLVLSQHRSFEQPLGRGDHRRTQPS